MEGNRWQHCAFSQKVREWRLQINNIPAQKQCKNFVDSVV